MTVRNPSPVLKKPGYGATVYKSAIEALNALLPTGAGVDARVFKMYCRWTPEGELVGYEAYYRNGRTCPPALYKDRPATLALVRNAQLAMHPEHVKCI